MRCGYLSRRADVTDTATRTNGDRRNTAPALSSKDAANLIVPLGVWAVLRFLI